MRELKIKVSQREREMADIKEKLAINEKRNMELKKSLEEQETKYDKVRIKNEIYRDFLD